MKTILISVGVLIDTIMALAMPPMSHDLANAFIVYLMGFSLIWWGVATIAKNKNRPVNAWLVGAFFGGIVTLAIIAFLPPKSTLVVN